MKKHIRRHQLTFKMIDLLPVRDGLKTFTVRGDSRLRGIAPGDSLRLAFGAYNNATVVEAHVERVEVVEWQTLLDHLYDPVDDWLAARYEWFLDNRPLDLWNRLTPPCEDHKALARICLETGGDPFQDLSGSTEPFAKPFMFAIWWTLAG